MLLLCVVGKAHAVEEPYVNELKGAQVAAGNFFTVADEKFTTSGSSTIQHTLSVDDIVTFEINFDTTVFFYATPFNCVLNFKIYIYGNISDTSIITDSTTHSSINLSLRYDTATGRRYKGIAMYKFNGAHKFKVKILGITSAEVSPIPTLVN